MKFTKLTAVIVCLNSNSWVATAASSIRGSNEDSLGMHNRVLKRDEGTFLVSDVQYEHDDQGNGSSTASEPHQTMNIELEDGLIYTLVNVEPAWAKANGKGKGLKSGRSKIKVGQGATISGATMDLHGGTPEVLDDGSEANGRGKNKKNAGGRSLATSHLGNKSVLAVKVIAADASYGFMEADLSDKVFGTNGAPVNLASQYNECSHGLLTISKATSRSMTNNPGDLTTDISDGVVTIKVDLSITEGDGNMVNAVTNKINSVFGYPSTLADHVMYCLPSNTIPNGGIAYAYIGSWLSVYSNEWCNYVSAQMHEVGHNLSFGHSGEGTQEYGDQSGMMGFSYGQDNGPSMCLNGAKSWQTGWYETATKEITPTAATNSCFNGALYGTADFEVGNNAKTVIVKINDSRSGEEDYFVAFNRRTGMNSGTVEGADQVLITRAGGEGEAYSPSTLVAKLSAGGSRSLSNFGGTNNNVVVTVDSIDTVSTPGAAQVRIEYAGAACDGISPPPTPLPTPSPTNSPCTGVSFKVDVLTDNYPGETSWSLVDTCTGFEKTSPTFSSPATLYSDTFCFPSAAHEFTIHDSYGDGSCCNYGEGSYEVHVDEVMVASGGQFTSSETTIFGSCDPQPTNSPTPLPTSNPTNAPQPTNSPTKSPTNQPTSSPSNAPTDPPTTANPTKSPTPEPTTPPVSFDCTTINKRRQCSRQQNCAWKSRSVGCISN